jgi:hypothetical protein
MNKFESSHESHHRAVDWCLIVLTQIQVHSGREVQILLTFNPHSGALS